MSTSSDISLRSERGFLLAAAAAGFFLVLLCTSRYGIGLFPDTAHYFAAADSFRAGEGLRGYDGAPYTAWPPLYPFLLAVFGLTGVSPDTAARVMNASGFGALVYLAGRFYFDGMRTRLFAGAGVLSVLLSMPLLNVSVMAYTDLLFALACLGTVLALERFSGRGSRSCLAGAALLAASAGLLRYMGLAVILTGVAAMLFSRSVDPFSKRLKNALFFGLISGLPLTIWVTRNLLISSTATGGRDASVISLGQNLLSTVDALTTWLMPSVLPFSIRGPAVLAVGILFISVFLRFRDIQGAKLLSRNLSPALLFTFIYPTVLIIVATGYFSDAISDRLLVPIYVFMIFGLFSGLESVYLIFRSCAGYGRSLAVLAAICAVLWLGYPLARVSQNTVRFIGQGAGGFSTAVWRGSPLVKSLRESSLHGDIYSNVGNAVYLLAGQTARKAPGRVIAGDIADLRKNVSEGHETYLVWFRVKDDIVEYRAPFYTIPEILSLQLRLERTAVFSDGEIYRVRPGTGMTVVSGRL